MVVRRGFSLIEVIVAMTLLSIALLAIAASGLFAARMLQEGRVRERAVVNAMTLADSLVVARAQGTGVKNAGLYRLEWSAADSTASVVVQLANGASFALRSAR